MTYILNDVANALHTGLKTAAMYPQAAANRANGVSAAAQSAQGTFNAGQTALANNITQQNLNAQYDYNSAMAQMANQFSSDMWDKTAAWNEMMWDKMAEFNRIEAQKNRDWQEHMRATAYQTAVEDLKAAGINPILAAGGITASGGAGSAANVGGASMSPISGVQASGGVIGGQAASESSYTGQMEYMSGILGLLSTAFAGITSAMKVFNDTPSGGSIANAIGDILEKFSDKNSIHNPSTKWNSFSDNIMKKVTGQSKWDNGNYNPYDKDYNKR